MSLPESKTDVWSRIGQNDSLDIVEPAVVEPTPTMPDPVTPSGPRTLANVEALVRAWVQTLPHPQKRMHMTESLDEGHVPLAFDVSLRGMGPVTMSVNITFRYDSATPTEAGPYLRAFVFADSGTTNCSTADSAAALSTIANTYAHIRDLERDLQSVPIQPPPTPRPPSSDGYIYPT